jgi:CrcB protein
MIALMVGLGALVGAPARYLTDRLVQSRHNTLFPFGTLCVNVVASVVLGVVGGASTHVSAEVAALVGTGFCGALSTFSTFSYEAMRLTARRAHAYAGTYVLVSVVAGVAAAAVGWWIGSALG